MRRGDPDQFADIAQTTFSQRWHAVREWIARVQGVLL
jgi:hypothetical protein